MAISSILRQFRTCLEYQYFAPKLRFCKKDPALIRFSCGCCPACSSDATDGGMELSLDEPKLA